MTMVDGVWAPEACALPSGERRPRLAEFDQLFATALSQQFRMSATHLRWELDPAVEATARDLTARESECCSFFAFTFTQAGDTLSLDLRVPATQVEVLDAVAARAAAGMTT